MNGPVMPTLPFPYHAWRKPGNSIVRLKVDGFRISLKDIVNITACKISFCPVKAFFDGSEGVATHYILLEATWPSHLFDVFSRRDFSDFLTLDNPCPIRVFDRNRVRKHVGLCSQSIRKNL